MAKGFRDAGFGKQVGEGGGAEGKFDGGGGVIEAAMEGAEGAAMGGEVERAVVNAAEGIDGVYDIEDIDVRGGAGEGEAAVFAAASGDESRAGEMDEEFGEIVGGNLGVGGDMAGGEGGIGVGGEPDGGAEGVFSRLGDHGAICGQRYPL